MFLFYIIQSFLKIIVSVVIMVGLDFRILPFIVVLSIIPIVQQKKNKEEQYKFNKEQITRQRKMDYVKGLFFGDAKCELRLYDLKNFCLENMKTNGMNTIRKTKSCKPKSRQENVFQRAWKSELKRLQYFSLWQSCFRA